MANISIVICAYTERRWEETLAAVASSLNQTTKPFEVVLVIDHNHALYERFKSLYHDTLAVVVIENQSVRGLSGARNSGITIAKGDHIAFLDDDAVADENWLTGMMQWCADADVIGGGGRVVPLWDAEKPDWFPEEFFWTVGCTYRGVPEKSATVRNPFGGCMMIKREYLDAAGGFRTGAGRIGEIPLGCEETELCIRIRQATPQKRFVYEPSSFIYHHVTANRLTWKYFLSRCYNEGISKAYVASLVGANDGLASERTYTLYILPMGVLNGVRDALLRFDLGGLGRAAAIITGLGYTVSGYVVGNVKRNRHLTAREAVDSTKRDSQVP